MVNLYLDDNLLRDMASAWPRLNILDLVSKPRKPLVRVPKPKTTLRCLVPFANHCPSIEALTLVIDAPGVSRLDLLTEHHKLGYIDLGRSPSEDTGSVATFLSGLSLSIKIKSEGHYSEQWNEVTALVKPFRAVRHQERRKAVTAIEENKESSVQFVKCKFLCPFMSSPVT